MLSKEKTRKRPTVLHRTVGTTRLERKTTRSLERSSFILAQAEIHPAPVAEAVPLLSEDHHFFDVGKLFERSINFRGHTCICTDPRRHEAPAEFDCRGSRLRNRTLLVQRQREVWTSNGQGCRTARWTTEHCV